MSAVPIVTATLMRPEGDTGVQTHFRTFHRWLAEQGLPFRLVTPFSSPRWQVYPVFALRRLIKVPSPAWGVWWYRYGHAYFLRAALSKMLADAAPCVVYAQCPMSAAAALQARRSPAQRVVLVVHFNVSQAQEWAGKGLLAPSHRVFREIEALEHRVLAAVDGLVFVSDFMRRELAARSPQSAARPTAVIPNFVDDPGETASGPAMGDLIAIGTLEARKNQAYLLDIVAAARVQGTLLRLTLVGDGPDRAALESRAAELGIADLVTFAGRMPDAASWIGRHKACVHAARIENLPITLIESLSRGRPVFAAPVGGVPEVFSNDLEGRLIPLDETDTAARIVVEWLREPERLAAAGRAARQRFLRDFETRTVAARLAAFLFDVQRA